MNRAMESLQLSTWNQVAPRAFVRQCYCFPFHQEDSLDRLRDHLRLALGKLSTMFPYLASKIYLVSRPRGRLHIRPGEDSIISLKLLDQRETFGWTYAQLKADGFPASAFVHASFDLPYRLLEDGEGVPVFEVHARVIEGGLLLCIYYHHSVSDGTSIDKYITSFAELTRDPYRTPQVQHSLEFDLDLPASLSHGVLGLASDGFRGLLKSCAEYQLLSNPTGPTQFSLEAPGTAWGDIQKTGRIFVIPAEQIRKLQERLCVSSGVRAARPSSFTCLAAITWAHVTKARLASTTKLLSAALGDESLPQRVRLMMSIDWRRRAYSRIMSASAGNTIALPLTSIDTLTLLKATSSDIGVSYASLGVVVDTIEAAIQAVDESFVAIRTSLIRTAPDPRLLGLTADPRDPCDFYFNTWRHFGAQTRWMLPGILGEDGDGSGVDPDAIRRAQADWNIGAGLVLPIRKENLNFEVLVTLDVDSMSKLCEDESWGRWVDTVLQ